MIDRTEQEATAEQVRSAGRIVHAYYMVAALVALVGGVTSDWMADTLLWWAVVMVATVELGGIALMTYAAVRRRLGEAAYAARVLSMAVAVFAVWYQWVGHADPRWGGFFAGISALAYTLVLITTAARRRDALRAVEQLPPPAPVYGLVQWVRHPGVTWQARRLALQNPKLGLYGSLAAVAEQRRTAARQAALAGLLRRRLAEGKSGLAAEIAVTTYDLDEIARRLAATADYDALTDLLAADLRPARVSAPAARAPRPAAVKPSGGVTSRRTDGKTPSGKGGKTPSGKVGPSAAMEAEYARLIAAGEQPTAVALRRAAREVTGKDPGGSRAAATLARLQAPEVLAEAEAALGGRDG